MNYETLFALLAGLLPFIGGIFAIANWVNSKFEQLSHRIESVQHNQSRVDAETMGKVDRISTEMSGKIELLEYRTNANTQLIDHRTQRFQQMNTEVHARMSEEVRRLTAQVDQLKGYLEKHGFKRREDDE